MKLILIIISLAFSQSLIRAADVELKIYFHDVTLSPLENGLTLDKRRTFKVYLKNIANKNIKILSKNKDWSEDMGGEFVLLTIARRMAPNGQLVTPSEFDFSPVELSPGELCEIHRFYIVSPDLPPVSSYSFEYKVEEYLGKKFGAWSGAVTQTMVVSEKLAMEDK